MKSIVGELWYCNKSEPLPTLENKIGVSIKKITNIDLLQKITNLSAEELTLRQKDKNKCFVAFLRENPVGFGWSCYGKASFGEPKRPIVVSTGFGYLWDAVTFPKYRGLGIHSLILQSRVNLAPENINHFLTLNQISNSASSKGIKKAGFIRYAEIIISNSNLMIKPLVFNDKNLLTSVSKMLNLEIIV